MAKLTFPKFIYTQLFTKLDLVKANLAGKTIIVTGANIGLGKETARHLAALNPGKLILACRNTKAGQESADDITATTGYTAISVWKLDLSDFDSVKAFAHRVDTDLDRLDILIENAGIATDKFSKSPNGHEQTIQINVLSTTMLALLCLPKLRQTVKDHKTRPRIVLVGSEVHFWAAFKEREADEILVALDDESKFVPMDRYNVSKLLDVLITRELGALLANSKVPEDQQIDINCPNPGLCHSSLSRNDDGYFLYILKILLARTTEYGARVFVWAATAPQTEKGPYVSANAFEEPSDFVLSEDGKRTQKRVWQEVNQVLRKECPQLVKL